ncbi:hypothetical protein [Salinispora oceanensis]|uniref:hypothetical protein n=1 Tax=Salinispora oceanensis TaxID=1050199 RepID=UPI00037C459D|nr:hypothetical protein [Salinispora oceanensis]
MNGWLLAGGSLACVTGLIHAIGGGLDTVRPLLGSGIPDEPKRTLHAVWHMVTVDLLLSGVALLGLGLASASNAPLVLFIGARFLAYSATFMVITFRVGWPRPLLRLPQWILLLPVAILTGAGMT